jgi:glycosyltransferase involved in cell wall biosynthesis
MTKPRLSICIATYNRAGVIAETLDSIIEQLTDEVEIVVVDGGSTDTTRQVVSSYGNICDRMRYVRLSVKGGVDQDFCKAVQLAQGDYCWLFSDDDLLKPGAIRAVLNEIGKGYCLIVVNAEVMNNNFSKVLVKKRLRIQANEIYDHNSQTQLFQRVIPYMSFIGCTIVQRDLWQQREKEHYFGTEFIHVGVVFQKPLPGPTLVLAEPHITIRLGNAQWTQRSFEVWGIKWPKLLCSFAHISKSSKKQFEKSKSWRRFGQIVAFRATGVYSLKEFNKYFRSERVNLWWRFIVFIVAIAPAFLLNFILLLFLKLVGHNSQMTIHLLENNENNIFALRRG